MCSMPEVKETPPRVSVLPSHAYLTMIRFSLNTIVMKRLSRSFAVTLPISALTFSIVLFVGMILFHYYGLKRSAHGRDNIYIRTDNLSVTIPSTGFLHFALFTAAFQAEKPIVILNAPGHFLGLLISYPLSRGPFWSPNSLGPMVWHCLSYPILALPAWSFVGFGIDAFLGRKRMRAGIAVLSAVLCALFGTCAAVLQFALSGDPGLVPGYATGFTLWTLLFTIPCAAWAHQRFRKIQRSSPVEENLT